MSQSIRTSYIPVISHKTRVLIVKYGKGTDKGNISIFDMLLDRKVGYLFNDFHEGGEYPTEDVRFSSLTLHSGGRLGIVGSQNGSLNVISSS